MREEANIKALVELKPDYMGFIFYAPSPRFVGTDWNPAIASSLPKEIKKVGVFVNAPLEDLKYAVEKYSLDVVQLHGKETPDYCLKVKSEKLQVIKAFSVDEDFDFSVTDAYQDVCDYVLFDTKTPVHGGSGVKFNWKLLEKYTNHLPIFLSGGISINDIVEIKSLIGVNIHALDINSRFELKPALKDINLIREFQQLIN